MDVWCATQSRASQSLQAGTPVKPVILQKSRRLKLGLTLDDTCMEAKAQICVEFPDSRTAVAAPQIPAIIGAQWCFNRPKIGAHGLA